jgi:hypothetical protein
MGYIMFLVHRIYRHYLTRLTIIVLVSLSSILLGSALWRVWGPAAITSVLSTLLGGAVLMAAGLTLRSAQHAHYRHLLSGPIRTRYVSIAGHTYTPDDVADLQRYIRQFGDFWPEYYVVVWHMDSGGERSYRFRVTQAEFAYVLRESPIFFNMFEMQHALRRHPDGR